MLEDTAGELKFPWVAVEKIRERKDVAKKDLAFRLGINYNYLVDLLNGRYPSKIDNRRLAILSEIFQMPVEEIIHQISGKVDKPVEVASLQSAPKEWPASADAGAKQMEVITIRSGEVVKELGEKKSCPNNFKIKLDDDSMYPPCPRGSIFVIASLKQPDLNNLVLTVIRDGRAWVGELLRRESERIILKPYNPTYDYLQIAREDIILISPVSQVELPG